LRSAVKDLMLRLQASQEVLSLDHGLDLSDPLIRAFWPIENDPGADLQRASFTASPDFLRVHSNTGPDVALASSGSKTLDDPASLTNLPWMRFHGAVHGFFKFDRWSHSQHRDGPHWALTAAMSPSIIDRLRKDGRATQLLDLLISGSDGASQKLSTHLLSKRLEVDSIRLFLLFLSNNMVNVSYLSNTQDHAKNVPCSPAVDKIGEITGLASSSFLVRLVNRTNIGSAIA
jgi:hypothetical protein